MENYLIRQDVLIALLEYLGTKPHAEVDGAIRTLRSLKKEEVREEAQPCEQCIKERAAKDPECGEISSASRMTDADMLR